MNKYVLTKTLILFIIAEISFGQISNHQNNLYQKKIALVIGNYAVGMLSDLMVVIFFASCRTFIVSFASGVNCSTFALISLWLSRAFYFNESNKKSFRINGRHLKYHPF